MYKLLFNIFLNAVNMIYDEVNFNNIPVNPENTDYQHFKEQINNETAILKDLDDNIMSSESAKTYIANLP